MISKEPVGAESRSGLIGFVVKVACLGCHSFGLWGWDRGCCSYFLSYGRLVSCIVVSHIFPAGHGKYSFFGCPCRLPCDLE